MEAMQRPSIATPLHNIKMTTLHLRLFHGFQANFDNGPTLDFPTSKVRALLAYLVIESEQSHLRSQLATLFWGDWREEQAKANLRKSLFRLRETLNREVTGFGDGLLEVTHTMVQLRPEHIQADLLTFRQLGQQVTQHNHPALNHCSACLDKLSRAVALYSGDLLAGLEVDDAPQFESWLTYQREQLHETAMAALANLTNIRLQRRDYELAQRLAQQQLQLEPWREEAHRQLMQALMGQGRREEALAQFGKCRAILAAELAIDPAGETINLFKTIQQNLWEEPAAPPLPAVSGPWHHHFPPQLTPFIGRAEELAAIQERLQDSAGRLLSLLGPGGIGKTRLVSEVVQRLESGREQFPAGCYFIPLLNVTTPNQLITAIGQQLGFTFRGGAEPAQQLLDHLANQALLLVLDNYEQLLPHTQFIEQILAHAPKVTLLVTGRVPLNLRAEWRFPLAGLTLPEPNLPASQVANWPAVQLFESAARRIDPYFQINETNATTITTLCRHLAGMPLALEIAASWLKIYTLASLANRIETGISFLTATARDIPERHRSLRVIFEQSWQLLAPPARLAFARLTCFQGHFSLEAALTVADLDLETLSTLLEHTLIQRLENERYSLHPLLQQFARDHLDKEDVVFEQHAAWYLGQVAQTAPQFASKTARSAVTLISQDLDNIRQAWQWAVNHQRADLLAAGLGGLESFYLFRGLYGEGRDYFGQAIEALASRPGHTLLYHRLRLAQASCYKKMGDTETAISLIKQVAAETTAATYPTAMIALAEIYELRGENSQAIAFLEQARQLLATHNAPNQLAELLDITGRVYRTVNRIQDGIESLSQALSLNRTVGNESKVAENYANLGLLYKDLGNFSEAIYHIEQAINLAHKLDHRENVARFTQNLGLVYWQQGELEKALSCYQKGLAIAEELESKRGIGMCAGGIGAIMRLMHRYEEGLAHYRRALQQAEASGDLGLQATLVGNMGNIYMDQGKYETAMVFLERAMALDRMVGSIGNVCRHLGNIGDILKSQGRFAEALACFEETIPQLRQIKDRYYLCWQLVSYGEVLYGLSRFAEARLPAEEGGQLALAVGRRPYHFLSQLLQVRLQAAGGDPAGAIRQLAYLQTQFNQPEELADLAFTQWQISQTEADRQTAGRILEPLATQTQLARHYQQLTALKWGNPA